jgi:polyhydroxybutyrate depolymerase
MQACPAQAYAPGEFAETIMFDGNTREYEVQVPASYDNSAPIPVVFDLHGLGSNSGQQQLISGWQALAEANGFAVVRPNGFGAIRSWNGGDTCCGTALSQNLDDVGLMKAILAEVKSQLCVDDKHVYASGLSNGGAMSHRLACDAPDVFAAVAPVSYPIAYLPISKCQPSQPVGVMHSHGTGDLTVNYNGGLGVASAPASFAQWGSNNNCVGDPVETFSMGASHCDTYENCDGGVEVTLCTINGPHILYNNNDNVKIAELAWAFFQKHSLP